MIQFTALRLPRTLLFLSVTGLPILGLPAAAAEKVMLAIGIDRYAHLSRLHKAENDARDMAALFARTGQYRVEPVLTGAGADRKGMLDALRRAAARAGRGGELVVFFSGHGVQVGQTNYLLPHDLQAASESELEDRAIPLTRLLAEVRNTGIGLSMVILDACRNNPLGTADGKKSVGGSKGLIPTTPLRGQVLAYAAGDGEEALDWLRRPDEPERNSLFTRVLLKHLATPGLPVLDALTITRDEVEELARRERGHSQRPGLYEDLRRIDKQRFVLFAAPNVTDGKPEPPAPPVRRAGDVFRDCAECPEMVVLPSGRFDRGDVHGDGYEDEKPVRTVKIAQPFAIGKYEVTQGEWRAVMGSNPSHFKDCGDRCPVEWVSWGDVQAFIGKLKEKTGKDYRLPSEAEWEYACRAGGRHKWCGSDNVDAVAWYDGNSGDKPHAVGGKRANGWGLHDMSGNVWEWVQDCYEEGYDKGQAVDGRAHEPSTDCARRVLRGGGWDNSARNARSAVRDWGTPDARSGILGFRLSRTLP